jgi:hypothetical protein
MIANISKQYQIFYEKDFELQRSPFSKGYPTDAVITLALPDRP